MDGCATEPRTEQVADDVRACQRLRYRAFFQARGLAAADRDGIDADEFDPACRHMMVEEMFSGALVCCFRLMPLASGAEIGRSYSARWYDLERLPKPPHKVRRDRGPRGGAVRILITEDDQSLAEALGYALGQAGYAVDRVGNGAAADEAGLERQTHGTR